MKWVFLFQLNISLLHGKLTNSFAIEINPENGAEAAEEIAKNLAEKHGFDYLGHVVGNIFHLLDLSTSPIGKEPNVLGIDQQRVKKRVKRDLLDTDFSPNDPLYEYMWYMNPDFEDRNENAVTNVDSDIRHMNVTGAWALGYTGQGVVVTLLDDGIERDHPDLIKNYDAKASRDINGGDDDPMPQYNSENSRINFTDVNSYRNPTETRYRLTEQVIGYKKESNRHGTRCAGEVAGEFGNGVCIPGIAYNAKIGGIRMLDGDVTDLVEGQSIGHNPQYVDIYSASWGPDDDGETVDGPDRAARTAFHTGAMDGRKGKGSIFVWASGNGGRYQDNCNCDGYTNSIYTVSISSTSEKENVPWYSEACASTLASTYSSGGMGERQIVTTDLRKICTKNHTGTSASAPIAAAILALVLEANPNLTWRDVQHLIVHTSKKRLLKTTDWAVNGAGRDYSHHYGYGLMDAGALVSLAANWTTVPEQRKCSTPVITKRKQMLFSSSVFEEEFQINSECIKAIHYTEHVLAKISLSYPNRGSLRITLVSPSGTVSNILDRRPHDKSMNGFTGFHFLTVHMWDERPYLAPEKPWLIRIENLVGGNLGGTIDKFELIVHGTGKDQYELLCESEKAQVFDPTQQACFSDCPLGTYRSDTNLTQEQASPTAALNICKPCNPNCLICTGSAEEECISKSSRSSSRPLRNPVLKYLLAFGRKLASRKLISSSVTVQFMSNSQCCRKF
ncbi:Oidioi.mRNA.OKI2018_I69.PAR.g10383.t1.cds [Oikopleura dioica]|uniref:Oidioi.mRNA.OKI2018_I69.PAR.g10383.t1.cds n=1 Tax=Oikopleura dioica TaxID=34765 RepID=A0ABN7RVJ3_OIKDI|nr:Oidioi.mRNA.OKI2018_I69.PAR.g10383.t1.cds [Oikopleura dioica]